ncbi:glycosyltransferase family 4 protein [Marinomonas sp. PE14-40]|uniref:glycosyltransferase family 4 protein n=1 Tax=Marinomonas sp. PE14-40 TaxID=3060621 RepID=UPI003F664A1E
MDIIYLSNAIIPSRTANSIHVMKMSSAFSSLEGVRVNLFARSNYMEEQVDLFEYYGCENKFDITLRGNGMKKGASLLNLPSLALSLSKYNKDKTLVYARDVYGSFLATLLGFEVVYESHGVPKNRLVKTLEGFLFSKKNFLKLVVISDKLKQLYLEKSKIKKNKILIAHDAADKNSYLGERNFFNRVKVGYVGHLYKGRGMDIIIKLAHSFPMFDFYIVGGEEADIKFWLPFQSKNLKFLGFMAPSKTDEFRAGCDILLMPYQRGLSTSGSNLDTSEWMSPMKLFEYMASDSAIIASDLPVLREVLNESNSVLAECDDINMWVSALNKLCDDSYRERLAKKALADFNLNYSWTKRANRVLLECGLIKNITNS